MNETGLLIAMILLAALNGLYLNWSVGDLQDGYTPEKRDARFYLKSVVRVFVSCFAVFGLYAIDILVRVMDALDAGATTAELSQLVANNGGLLVLLFLVDIGTYTVFYVLHTCKAIKAIRASQSDK